MTLVMIVAAALAGGVLSTLAAAATLRIDATWIPRFVSFAVGALLGAVFLELLPHALEDGDAHSVMLTVLVGLLAFFLLEKLVLWRHAHGHDAHSDAREESEHQHALHAHATPHADGGRSGLMILIGNAVHNFCDGIVIAAAFIAGESLGIATTLAIVAHAMPQQSQRIESRRFGRRPKPGQGWRGWIWPGKCPVSSPMNGTRPNGRGPPAWDARTHPNTTW